MDHRDNELNDFLESGTRGDCIRERTVDSLFLDVMASDEPYESPEERTARINAEFAEFRRERC